MNVRCIVLTLVAVLSGLGPSVQAEEFELPLTDDAWINGNAPTTNFGMATTLTVHNYGPKFSLIRFDAAAIAGKTVQQANLVIFVRSLGSAGTLTVYPIVSSWNESTVTWARQPPTEAAAIANIALTNAPDLVEIDVTSVVQRWADGAIPDAGFLLTTVEPIKASLDSKELAGGNPSKLTVSTSADTGPETFILDLSRPEDCTIDSPGYYVMDRTWWLSPHDQVEPNASCGGAIRIASSGVTLDLQGFSIAAGGSYGVYEPVLRIDTTSSVALRNGRLVGVFVSIDTSVAGGTVTLENIHAGGGVLLGGRSVTVTGGSYSGYWEPGLRAGAGSRVTGARFGCNADSECLSVKGASWVTGCTFSVGSAGPPAIAVGGDDTIIEGNLFNEWIYVAGNRNIVSRNFSGGGYIEVHGAGNIIDGNIGPGITFESTGNFYGGNRAKGGFSGTDGNIDWGGNVTY
jgi:hypothetical protein